jgi:hypothetical protein
LPALAADLVGRKVAVIVKYGPPHVRRAKNGSPSVHTTPFKATKYALCGVYNANKGYPRSCS